MASSCPWVVNVSSAGGSSKTSESRQRPDTTGVEGLRTTPFFGLAPDPDAERLDSDAECRKNIGEELHSHFNYERDTLKHADSSACCRMLMSVCVANRSPKVEP